MSGQQLREKLGDDWEPEDGWSSLESVDLHTLIPTQWPHYSPCRLCQQRLGRPVEGNDHPKVIRWSGSFYIWDGHTRIARWLREGLDSALVRLSDIVE